MNEENLINHYNKHNESKRLKNKHANIEFVTAMKYIHEYVKNSSSILDIGAAMGAYSVPLSEEGFNVTAFELVKHNIREIEINHPSIKCIEGNAINLKGIPDDSYDAILLFGPMYHLISYEEKLQALKEAKRVLKPNGYLFISYCMNEYAIITHAFKEHAALNIKENINDDYKVISKPVDLYSYVRLEDINKLVDDTKLKRVKILSQDGPAEYLKQELINMNEEEYQMFIDYHFKTCELPELLGAGRHILDILTK